MSQVQLPNSSDSSTPREWPRYRVHVKEKWTDDWQTFFSDTGFDTSYLVCLSVSLSAAPTMPRATFRWEAGDIKREDRDSFDAFDPTDLRDYWVRVQIIPETPGSPGQAAAAANSGGDGQTVFIGRFIDQQTDWQGDDVADFATANQDVVAMGVEYEFMRTPIVGAWCTNDGEDAFQIDHTLVFNENYLGGASNIGNASIGKISNPDRDDEDGGTLEAHVFAKEEPDANVWTTYDIVQYLLAYYGPKGISIDIADAGATGGGGGGVLDRLIQPKVTITGKNLFEALNAVIDRRRGVGWCLRLKDAADASSGEGDKLVLHVFTVFDEEVSFDDQTIPPNKEITDLDVTHAIEIEQLVIKQDTAGKVDKIIVEGERIVSCFSLQHDGWNTLEPAWSTSAQTAYNQAGTNEESAKATNDAARKAPRFSPVYTTFRVPDDWGWMTNGDDDSARVAAPTVDEKGKLQIEQTADTRTWGHRFLRFLPIRKKQGGDDVSSNFEPEYERPMVFIRGTGDTYFLAHDNAEANRFMVRLLDSDFAIEVRSTTNHLLASPLDWAGAYPSKVALKYDWRFMIVTVAARTDTCLRVVETLGDDNAPAAGDTGGAERTIYIRVPGAEMWYIVPDTVTGIDADGHLVKRNGPQQSDPIDPEKDQVVRDDSPRLRRIAAMAKAWYSKSRCAVEMTTRQILLGYPIGSYVTQASDSGLLFDVNSVVSQVVLNFADGTTTLHTDFGELDFVGRFDRGGGRG